MPEEGRLRRAEEVQQPAEWRRRALRVRDLAALRGRSGRIFVEAFGSLRAQYWFPK